MKIEVGGKTFEYTVNGKDPEGDEVFEAFIALGGSYFPFAVVTRGSNEDAAVRAVTFAADEEYANALIENMEPVLGADEEIGLLGLETGGSEAEDETGTDI